MGGSQFRQLAIRTLSHQGSTPVSLTAHSGYISPS
jgi:hypothetical protein